MYDEHKYTETNAPGAPGAKRAFCLNRQTIELAGVRKSMTLIIMHIYVIFVIFAVEIHA